ncbi:hypothetical protein [Mesorhizobium sp. B2-4-6]|uniref:hypothetical protein n=1 Tax=Mesorhizobium sp. B2-4-6 TaxID=2589943 RepID=UPI00112C42EF|nr:hypothetical protein [Mesorhizobium sp. B2-4-6]TPL40634.1 hypothetical protein FJ957_25730 [Mesorhizobium sp. B2-4-6]
MTARCKHCGQLVDGFDAEAVIFRAKFSHLQARIFRCIAGGNGQFVGWQFIAMKAYADDPLGGPDNAANVITAMIFRMRRKLRELGVTIEGHKGGDGGYRISVDKENAA